MKCKWYTLYRNGKDGGAKGYLEKAVIKASPLIFWSTPDTIEIVHAPKKYITGIKTYTGDEFIEIKECPCIGNGILNAGGKGNVLAQKAESLLIGDEHDSLEF